MENLILFAYTLLGAYNKQITHRSVLDTIDEILYNNINNNKIRSDEEKKLQRSEKIIEIIPATMLYLAFTVEK